MVEERKLHTEQKDEEVKLMERSIEEHDNTVCSLENKACWCFYLTELFSLK